MAVDRGAERRSEILGLLRFGAIHGQWEGRLMRLFFILIFLLQSLGRFLVCPFHCLYHTHFSTIWEWTHPTCFLNKSDFLQKPDFCCWQSRIRSKACAPGGIDFMVKSCFCRCEMYSDVCIWCLVLQTRMREKTHEHRNIVLNRYSIIYLMWRTNLFYLRKPFGKWLAWLALLNKIQCLNEF